MGAILALIVILPFSRALFFGLCSARDPSHRAAPRSPWFFFFPVFRRRLSYWPVVWILGCVALILLHKLVPAEFDLYRIPYSVSWLTDCWLGNWRPGASGLCSAKSFLEYGGRNLFVLHADSVAFLIAWTSTSCAATIFWAPRCRGLGKLIVLSLFSAEICEMLLWMVTPEIPGWTKASFVVKRVTNERLYDFQYAEIGIPHFATAIASVLILYFLLARVWRRPERFFRFEY